MARLSLDEIAGLCIRALEAAGVSAANAKIMAASIVDAEAEGLHSHGLLRLPAYCMHVRSGKVDGRARPVLEMLAPGAVAVDARGGFAHPAIKIGLDALIALARTQAIASLTVRDSYNSGVMGHHVERLAAAGLVGLGFSNAPATIAPAGGKVPVFGTNPIALGVPRAGHDPIVIDQAASVVARGEVLLRARQGKEIPATWGLDHAGHPTTDPNAVLQAGSMAPAGGHKGAGLALLVEILAAALSGSRFSFEAGSLTEDDGRRAGIGQMFVAIEPAALAGPDFSDRIAVLCDRMLAQPGVRIPGGRRASSREDAGHTGVEVEDGLLTQLRGLAGEPGNR